LTLRPTPETSWQDIDQRIDQRISSIIAPLSTRVAAVETTNAEMKLSLDLMKQVQTNQGINIDLMAQAQINTINFSNQLAGKVTQAQMKMNDIALQNQNAYRRPPNSRRDQQLLIFNKDNLPRLLLESDLFNIAETELLKEGTNTGRHVGLLRDVLEAFYEKKGYDRGFNSAWKVKDETELREFLAFAGGAANFVINVVGSGDVVRYRLALERKSRTGLKEESPIHVSE
jgi:hypothetical protein